MPASEGLMAKGGDGRTDAVAVIGMSCRFPGAPGIGEFWELLRSGGEAIGRAADGRRRGTIDGAGDFDAAFFGMSPREAAVTDPQQRLVLELGWEALEDAGIVPGSLRGEAVSVFMGAMNDDYATLLHRAGAPVGTHTATGLQRAMLANRLSYFLGTRGPSLLIDTAQSSSLVAVALAVESLRGGTSRLALAGGVNLILAEDGSAAMERLGALSPDGRCYTFDARANGYVRGEGGAVVVLKRLADALADGDRVYCTVRGAATGNDGGGPGLTAPDRAGQEAVLRAACDQAGVRPADVRFVELHGTGTPVGDPVEAHALGAVYGPGRAADSPLLVGSVKTNIGHLEGAAGVAGLVKAALCLRERTLPATLNHDTPSPAIPLEQLRLKVQTARAELRPGPDGAPLLAGVSAFGMGGTNCHVVLEQAPEGPETPQMGAAAPLESAVPSVPSVPSVTSVTAVPLLLLSARSGTALRAQAERLRAHLTRTGAAPRDVAYSLATTRTLFEHRAALPCGDTEQLATALGKLADGEIPAGGRVGAADLGGGTAMMFAGQGAQRAGMGQELHASDAEFAAALDEVCAELDTHLTNPSLSLRDVMFAPSPADLLDQTVYTQPALFALETALYRTLTRRGVRPDMLLGHSVGEIAAAHAAGIFSLSDAARLVTARGRLMGALPPGGGMLSVRTTEEHVTHLLTETGQAAGPVSIAAVNGPTSIVLSGQTAALETISGQLTAQGIRTTWLKVSHAFHSALMDPVLHQLRQTAETIHYHPPHTPFIPSAVTHHAPITPDYWVEHARTTVHFTNALHTAQTNGATIYLEIGPQATLTAMADQNLETTNAPPLLLPTLRRNRPEWDSLLETVATIGVRGDDVDWSTLYERSGAQRTDLPTYAFQRSRYWAKALDSDQAAPAGAHTADVPDSLPDVPADEPRLTAEPNSVDSPERLLRLVVETTATVLGHDSSEEVVLDRTFTSQGLDSVTAVELCDLLGAALGRTLAPTLVYNLPTPHVLADHLAGTPHSEPSVGQATPVTAAAPADDPIAIVGVGCRFPGGADSRTGLWDLVATGTDAISPFPTDRGWNVEELYDPEPGIPGKSYVREGGFLHGAAEFDPEFFGISPREATAMDPQQRLLLETSWEALEDAGVVPESLRGGDTGVFVGAVAPEYGPRLHEGADGHEGYLLTGTTASVASGRIAYVLGTRGPALTVDTACSSSLVALHLAVQSLRRGECTMALAGGATVMSGPGMFVEFSQQRGLAPNGRCKPFSADADGTAWSDGIGMLALERLSDARRQGHRVLAVVRGSAVNQDGASNGLTAPSGPAQQKVIREALADAGLAPGDIDAVEAHGTGTPLGDPIEAEVLLATYGKDRQDTPVWLGSLKSNIGHTQAAAGVAGIIKMIQAIRHSTLPRTLHVDAPSSRIDWNAGDLQLLTQARPWPVREDRPRRAAVSAFGVSGTNAHLILEEPPPPSDTATTTAEPPALLPWLLSARSEEALRGQAARLRTHLEHTDADPLDVAYSLATTRSSFTERAVVLGRDRTQLLTGLDSLAQGHQTPDVIHGTATRGHRTAMLFAGQGAQRAGMGRELHASDPEFATALDEVCAELDTHLTNRSPSLRDVMFAPSPADLLDQTEYTQPALFALETALYRTLTRRGVRPDMLLGHSVGEIAAAHAAGIFTLHDAARLVTARGRLMSALPPGGSMLSVQATEEHVTHLLTETGQAAGPVSIAAVNGPTSIVLSGQTAALETISGQLTAQGIRTTWLKVSHAFHSALMDPVLHQLRQTAETIDYHPPHTPFIPSAVTEHDPTTPDYWVEHARTTVHFTNALHTAQTNGATIYLEIGPQATLTAMTDQNLETTNAPPLLLPTLRRNRPEWDSLLETVATIGVRGDDVDWSTLYERSGAQRTDLPTYAFQRSRYWLNPALAPTARDVSGTSEASVTDRLRYRVAWQAAAEKGTVRSAERWLMLVPDDPADAGLTVGIERELTARGTDVHSVGIPVGADRETIARLLRTAEAGEAGEAGDAVTRCTRVLWLATAAPRLVDAVALVQALAEAGPMAPLWIATRGAVAAQPGEEPSVAGAQLWGLGQVAGVELAERWGGLVDLPVDPAPAALRALAGVLVADAPDNQLAVRACGAFVRRVVPAPGRPVRRDWKPSGTVLITGGTGALGAQAARRLARAGAPHLLLVSRRGDAGPGVNDLVEELTVLGVEVTVAACDVADRNALTALLAGVPDDRPLTAVLHTAGVLGDGVLDGLGPERIDDVLRAKTTAARHLDELTANLPLDAFVLFSSIVGVWGNGGQATYAAANAALDALAQRRAARGQRATSIAWGPWAGAGMAAGTGARSFERDGIEGLAPEQALDILDQAVCADETSLIVADVDWAAFLTRSASRLSRPLFDGVPAARAARAEADQPVGAKEPAGGHTWLSEGSGASGLSGLSGLSIAERQWELLDLVRAKAAEVLRHGSAAAIDPETAFRESGFDSLTLLELRNRLTAATGLSLPSTLLFDRPTPTALARHLHDELFGADTSAAGSAGTAIRPVADPEEPIAVVGMACRYPGGVASPEELWDLVATGTDVISAFPTGRGWDVEELYDPEPGTPGKSYVRQGGFLHEAAEFDPEFFGISPREATAMDPQQRLLLETSWEALERAGIKPEMLRGTRTGVFSGASQQDYAGQLHDAAEKFGGHLLTGNLTSVISGRVAYTLGLEGPALTVDTACSSSLVAMHLAIQSLRRGECDLALAGGTTIMATPTV
ncbi:SDR family NAD(P)-dependent oxidoreductase, partial [Streptomyces sp. NPDC088116]|uniref:type I polyketide synthase n=1 Tax=Streptomyces sp. NPDC088116 TaxID=3365825 RepID=UPI0037F1D975